MALETLQEKLDASLRNASPLTREFFADSPMTAEAVRDFVNDVLSVSIATVSKSGKPHAALTLVACADDGSLYAAVNERSVLYRNLQHAPDVAITVDAREHGLMGQGCAQYVGTAAELRTTLIAELDRAAKRGRWVPQDWAGAVYRLDLDRIFAT